MADDLLFSSIAEVARRYRSGGSSPVALTRAFLDRIESFNTRLHAFIRVRGDAALAEAETAERELARGVDRGPLHGIPIALKDQFDVEGEPTTAGSRFAPWVAGADATVVARLRAAGAVFIGKTNMSEFALGLNIEYPYGVPLNPWDETRQPGTSSSGSAGAVAAGLATAAIGGETSGSIRGPSSWCGLTGIRPTWGRVSRFGAVPLVWFFDTAGPMAHTAEDCAIILSAIAGRDERDVWTSALPAQTPDLRDDLRGIRVGVLADVSDGPWDRAIVDAYYDALEVLRAAGATVKTVSLPSFRLGGVIANVIVEAIAASVHEHRLREHPDRFDVPVRRRLLAGNLIPSVVYDKVTRYREIVRREVMAAFDEVDTIVTPGQTTIATPLATSTGISRKQDLLDQLFGQRMPGGIFICADVPLASIPTGFDRGLPVSMFVVGRPFDEATVLGVGHAYQQRTAWHRQRPSVG